MVKTIYRLAFFLLVIPKIAIADNNNDDTVYVNDDVSKETIIVELEANTLSPYIQAQTIIKLRLFRDATSFDAAMSYPELSDPITSKNVMLRNIGINKRRYRMYKNNRLYVVTEQEYVLYPEQSGELIIGPSIFQGHIVKGGTISFVEVESNIINLDVRPIPQTYSGNIWIPARSVELYQDFQPPSSSLEVGKPISRNLFLSATGLGSGHIPSFKPPQSTGFRVYPRQTERKELEHAESGLIAVLQQEIVFVPTVEGTFEVPEISVPWWNTIKDKEEIAYFPGKTLKILPTKDTESAQKKRGGGIADSIQSIFTNSSKNKLIIKNNLKYIVLTIVSIAILFSTYLFLIKKNLYHVRRNQSSVAYRKFLHACNQNDAKSAEKHLINFINNYNTDFKIRSLSELAFKVNEEFKQELLLLNSYIYSSKNINWNGDNTAEALKKWKKQNKHLFKSISSSQLPKLYPLALGE